MNDVEEYYLQHFGVKGMKWGVRKKSNPAKLAKKQAKKANKALYKEAKRDVNQSIRAKNTRNKDLIGNVDREINRKRSGNKDYDQAYGKAKKANTRKYAAIQVAVLANMGLAIALATKPEAVYRGADVVGAVLGKAASKAGGAASTAGMYAKYAAKASVPVSRTVKNRGYVQAILVNSGNKVGFPG